jgi:hypothetical protein
MGRRGHRRLRRSKLRYRAPRFDNRGNQKKGWLAPSAHKGFGDLPTTVYQVKEIQNMHTLLNFTCLRIDRNTDAGHSYTRCFAARIEFNLDRL